MYIKKKDDYSILGIRASYSIESTSLKISVHAFGYSDSGVLHFGSPHLGLHIPVIGDIGIRLTDTGSLVFSLRGSSKSFSIFPTHALSYLKNNVSVDALNKLIDRYINLPCRYEDAKKLLGNIKLSKDQVAGFEKTVKDHRDILKTFVKKASMFSSIQIDALKVLDKSHLEKIIHGIYNSSDLCNHYTKKENFHEVAPLCLTEGQNEVKKSDENGLSANKIWEIVGVIVGSATVGVCFAEGVFDIVVGAMIELIPILVLGGICGVLGFIAAGGGGLVAGAVAGALAGALGGVIIGIPTGPGAIISGMVDGVSLACEGAVVTSISGALVGGLTGAAAGAAIAIAVMTPLTLLILVIMDLILFGAPDLVLFCCDLVCAIGFIVTS